MSFKLTPCFYFPTTVISVDDNIEFLQLLQFGLGDCIQNKYFDDPIAAKNFLLSDKRQPLQITRTADEEEDENSKLEINLQNFSNQIYNRDRHDNVAVVLIDYAMPSINGCELCKMLNSSNYQIILLTGIANEADAIHYFNQGVIKRYLRKDTPDLIPTLKKFISDLQLEFFQHQSLSFIEQIHTKSVQNGDITFLKNKVFSELFFNITRKYSIIEYYLIGKEGSFIMLTSDRKIMFFVVKSEGDMQAADDIIKFNHEKIPADIYQGILNRHMLLHFFTENALNNEEINWRAVAFKAFKAEKGGDFYYTMIDAELTENSIEASRVIWHRTVSTTACHQQS